MNLKKKFVIGAASLALVAGMGVAPAMAAVVPLPNGGEFNLDAQRLAGDQRLATSMAVAAKAYKDHENEVKTVYLIGYDAVIDAATAGMLNGSNSRLGDVDGPALSCPQDMTTQKMLGTFIKKTFPTTSQVVAIGGTATVSDAALKAVADAAGVSSDRVGGANRYATSVEIAKKAFSSGPDRQIYVARGDNPVDALAAGTLEDHPVLLVNHEGDVDKSVKEYVKDNNIGWDDLVVIGGEESLSNEQLQKMFTGENLPKAPEITPWTAEEIRAGYVGEIKRAAAVWFGQEAWQNAVSKPKLLPDWNYRDGATQDDRRLALLSSDVKGFFPLEKSSITVGTKTENESDVDTSDAVKADGKGFEGYVPLTQKYKDVNLWVNSTDATSDNESVTDPGSATKQILALKAEWDKAVQNLRNAADTSKTAAQLAAKDVAHQNAGTLNNDYKDATKKAAIDAIKAAIASMKTSTTAAANNDKAKDDAKVKPMYDALVAAKDAGVTGAPAGIADTDTIDTVARYFGTMMGASGITNFATFKTGSDAENAWNAAIADEILSGSTETKALYAAGVALFGKDSVDKNWPTISNGKIQKKGIFTFAGNTASSLFTGADITAMVNADKTSGAQLFYIEKDKSMTANYKKAFATIPTSGVSATEYNSTIVDLAARDADDLDKIFVSNQNAGNDTDKNQSHSINWWALRDLVNDRVKKFNEMKKAAGDKLIKAVMDYRYVGVDNASTKKSTEGSEGALRIFGSDRYKTSAMLSIFQSKCDTGKPNQVYGECRFDKMKSVYLASGDSSFLIDPVFAGMVKDGTILLVPSTGEVDPLVATELKRKGTAPRKMELLKEGIAANAVWAVGGKKAISDDVFTSAVNAMFGKKAAEKATN